MDEGWVSVGITSETAQFAVNTIISWWEHIGQARYPNAQTLTLTADSGGSNNPRTRVWRYELQRLADTIGLNLRVCHFPPGTSKWNKSSTACSASSASTGVDGRSRASR